MQVAFYNMLFSLNSVFSLHFVTVHFLFACYLIGGYLDTLKLFSIKNSTGTYQWGHGELSVLVPEIIPNK